MAKFLIRANYVGDGIKGLAAEGGSKRRDAAKTAIESVGGSLECMYFAFGETDVYAICDVPDNATAAALSFTINSTGAVALNLTPLMTADEVDAAVGKKPTYRPPGS